jgi:hypothetical protein
MAVALDHLVVAAHTLEAGVAWCEATFGIVPGPGGRHPLMGTHNRLLSIATPAFPRAYLEIIAIDPQAPAPGRPRWFDFDDASLRAAIERAPALVHWVARCADIDAEVAALARLGIDRGRVIEASRDTPAGRLSWRISVRDDGARLFGGALPTLIEWSQVHPADTMPASGATLESLTVRSPEVAPLRQALRALGADAVRIEAGAPVLAATLNTPRGRIRLRSPTDLTKALRP